MDMDIYDQIDSVIADKSISTDEKIGRIVSLHQTIEGDTDEFYEVGCMAYQAIGSILQEDENRNDYAGDILMCSCLLAESYYRTGRTWNIPQLAQQAYNIMEPIDTDDEESLKTMIGVIDQLCFLLTGLGYPRLMLKLYALQWHYEKQLSAPARDALYDTAMRIVELSELTHCDTWIAPIESDIKQLLGNTLWDEIKSSPYEGSLVVDKVEYTPEWESIIEEVDMAVAERMSGKPVSRIDGWRIRQEILSEKGIEWHMPTQLNPGVNFD